MAETETSCDAVHTGLWQHQRTNMHNEGHQKHPRSTVANTLNPELLVNNVNGILPVYQVFTVNELKHKVNVSLGLSDYLLLTSLLHIIIHMHVNTKI